MSEANKSVFIYDTTLRDGTQGEGFSLSGLDKIRIAERLDAFGVDYIEGGWPGSNQKDVEFFEAAKTMTWKHAKIAAFGSTRRKDTLVEEDPQILSLLAAETPVITFFGKSWKLHVTDILKTTVEENQAMVRDTARFFKSHDREVIFDAEHFFDGYKDDEAHALGVLQAAVDGGADCLVLCDTNGGTLPDEVASITATVVERFPETQVGIHTHNDCELAVANAIASVQAGACHVQGTINGYGERTGNCNLTSVIPIVELKLNQKLVPDLAKLKEISFFVDDLSNNVHFNRAPFVGKTAFAHKGGMHVNAVQKLSESYEHIRPQLVGNEQHILVSELSGQSNILMKAEALGLPLEKGSAEAKAVLQQVKDLEKEGYSYESAGGSLELLIRKATQQTPDTFELIDYQCAYRLYSKEDGHDPVCEATVKIKINDEVVHTVAEGSGVVDALNKALRKAIQGQFPALKEVTLTDYKVRILDGDGTTAAKTRVLITHTSENGIWGTVGVSDSIIQASAIALIEGLKLGIIRS